MYGFPEHVEVAVEFDGEEVVATEGIRPGPGDVNVVAGVGGEAVDFIEDDVSGDDGAAQEVAGGRVVTQVCQCPIVGVHLHATDADEVAAAETQLGCGIRQPRMVVNGCPKLRSGSGVGDGEEIHAQRGGTLRGYAGDKHIAGGIGRDVRAAVVVAGDAVPGFVPGYRA